MLFVADSCDFEPEMRKMIEILSLTVTIGWIVLACIDL